MIFGRRDRPAVVRPGLPFPLDNLLHQRMSNMSSPDDSETAEILP
jgi:hypothetical protein